MKTMKVCSKNSAKEIAIELLDCRANAGESAERYEVNDYMQQFNDCRISHQNNNPDVVADHGVLAQYVNHLQHLPTHATRENFHGLFDTVQLNGRPNDVMIGDHFHDVWHLMTSSALHWQ